MPIQTTYGFSNDVAILGMPYDLEHKDDITCFADTDIPFGVGLVYADAITAEKRIKVALPSAGTQVFIGVALFTHKQSSGDSASLSVLQDTQNTLYKKGDDITVRKQGNVYVYSEQAVDLDLPVYLRFATGTAGEVIGQFRVDADTNQALLVSNAQWRSKTTAAGLAVLSLGVPRPSAA